MGAFFLFKNDENFNKSDVKKLFHQKGFLNSKEFFFNEWTLWLYQKQLLNSQNYIYDHEKNNGIFAVGTFIYKNLKYEAGLRQIYSDYFSNKIENNELIGSYCIIFLSENNIHIKTDSADIYRIFRNDQATILSSSFLAILRSTSKSFAINKFALMEQLLLGFVTPTDTLVDGIKQVNREFKEISNFNNFSWSIESYKKYSNKKTDFKESVIYILRLLLDKYNAIYSFAENFGIDLGISGGYDSRLNILLCFNFMNKVNCYTYIDNEHSYEYLLADKITNELNLKLNKIQIAPLSKKSQQELFENIEDSVLYYDGRTNMNMGSYNEVHTKKLRKLIISSNSIGLNGLGGELFRNRENVPNRNIIFQDWLKYFLLKPHTNLALTSKELNMFINEYLIKKYIKETSLDDLESFNLFKARIFFREIWIPNSIGIRHSAENQLAFFITPFTESDISLEAINMTRHIGINGKFESAMLSFLNNKIAKIPSSYGIQLDKPYIFYLLKSYFKGMTPNKIKIKYQNLKIKKNSNVNINHILNFNYFEKDIIGFLKGTALPINWDLFLLDKNNYERSIFIGHTLLSNSDKINLTI